MDKIPEQMIAVVLDSYAGVDGLCVERRPVPKPGKDEVLVKVAPHRSIPLIWPSWMATTASRIRPQSFPVGKARARLLPLAQA